MDAVWLCGDGNGWRWWWWVCLPSTPTAENFEGDADASDWPCVDGVDYRLSAIGCWLKISAMPWPIRPRLVELTTLCRSLYQTKTNRLWPFGATNKIALETWKEERNEGSQHGTRFGQNPPDALTQYSATYEEIMAAQNIRDRIFDISILIFLNKNKLKNKSIGDFGYY